MRVPFQELFQFNPDGTVTPTKVVSVGCVIMFPGVKYRSEDSFMGVDLMKHRKDDMEVDSAPERDIVYIKGFFDGNETGGNEPGA